MYGSLQNHYIHELVKNYLNILEHSQTFLEQR